MEVLNPLPHPPSINRYVCDALLLGGCRDNDSLGAIATQLHTGAMLHTGAIATQLHTGAMLLTGAIATQLHAGAMLHTGAIATQLHTGAMLHNLADARDLTVKDLASARDKILLTQETLRSMTLLLQGR